VWILERILIYLFSFGLFTMNLIISYHIICFYGAQNPYIHILPYQAISHWKRRWSTISPFLLHMQRMSTTMTYRFLILSKVKIFLRAANQAKKATLKVTLVRQTLFRREAEAFTIGQGTVEESNLKKPSFGGKPPQLIFTLINCEKSNS
jgi:hypothetical protein